MAERRMFAKSIVLSDAFLDMPMSARCLYFTLAMLADDDGFVSSPKAIMRQCGASTDDLNILAVRKFIITFVNGVIVIKHWRIHNYIRQDTYNETPYKEQKEFLELDENKAYRLINGKPSTDRGRLVDGTLTQDSIGKDSIGKDRLEDSICADKPQRKRFQKPTIEEITAYCNERGNTVDVDRFFDYYESNGWKVGKNPMKDWKAAIRTWEKGNSTVGGGRKSSTPTFADIYEMRHGRNDST